MRELSILIPSQNDAGVLLSTLEALHGVVTYNSLNAETLIIDDASTDNTVEVAVAAALRFPALHIRVLARKHLQPGLGGVLRYGLAFCEGRYCVLVSSDGQDPIELIPIFLRHLRNGKQLVQCSRYLDERDSLAIPAKYRAYQAIYRFLGRWILGQPLADSTYAFRGFDRVFVLALGVSGKRFNVCPEMTFKVLLCGGAIEYVPGKPRTLQQGGQSKFRLSSEILGYAYVLARAGLHRFGLRRWF